MKPALLAAALLFLLHAAFSLQGLDVADEGYSWTLQWLVHAHPDALDPDPRWLSHWLCGLWPAGSLLGVRLGGALLAGLAGGIACALLAPAFGARAAVLAVLATGATKLYAWPIQADYNTLPAALCLAAVALLLWGRAAPLAGLLLGVAVAARPPLVPALLLPGLLVLLRSRLSGERADSGRWRAAGIATLSAALALALLLSGLVAAGRAPSPVALVARAEGSPYAAGSLLRLLFWSGASGFARGGQALFAALVLGVVVHRVPGPFAARALLHGLAGTTGLFLWIGPRDIISPGLLFPGLALALSAAVLLGLLLGGGKLSPRWVARGELLGAGLFLLLLAPLGSTNQFLTAHYGLWLAWPAACLCLVAIPERESSSRGTAAAGVGLLVACAAFGLSVRWFAPFRDTPPRRELDAPIDHPLLGGIRTSPGRAASLDEVLRALDGRVRPGEPLLAFGHVSLLHRLTGTVPALGEAWPDTLGIPELKARLATWDQGRAPPRLAVRALFDGLDPRWGARHVPWDRRGPRVEMTLIDAALLARGYRVVWSNRDFAILEAP